MNPPSAPSQVVPAESLTAEARRLATLAWPVIVGFLGMMMMGVVDVVMVGHLGEYALASVSLGHIWGLSIVLLARGVIHGIDPVVSQAFGSGDRQAAGMGLVRGLVLAVFVGVPVMGWHLFAESGLRWLGQPVELLELSGEYCWALMWGVIPTLVFMAGKQFLQGMGIMRPAAWVMLTCNLVNVFLNWALMYGAFGLPALGAVGCGWSTSICQFFCMAMLAWICRDTFREWWPGTAGALDWVPLRHLLGLGLPIGLQIGLEVWAFNMAGLMMGWLGTTAIAAHTVALNLASVAFMVPLGVSAAAATRVGNLIGAKLPWARSAWLSVGMGAGVMVLSGTLFVTVPEIFVGIYTDDAHVVALAAMLLPLAGAFQIFDGVQVVSFGVLRGASDVRVPTVFNVVGYWILGLPIGAWLAIEQDVGPRGIWMGLIIGLFVVSIMLIARIRWRIGQDT